MTMPLTIDQYAGLNHHLSRYTVNAPWIPVTDDEAETLKSRDYAGAIALVEATGDTKAARAMLGIDTPPLQVERRTL